jgi:uncharacterized LabA/DUF88 family protein
MKKVLIFVDGQNLYHCLRDLGVKEINIDWTKFFNSFIEEGEELIRTYWFRPKEIKPIYYTKEEIKTFIIKDKYSNGESIPSNIDEIINLKIDKIKKWSKNKIQIFSQVDYKYTQLEATNDSIEIFRSGILRADPYNETCAEKGVDVSLAVKMVEFTLLNKVDKIILISGDFDYAEALNIIKNNLKKIHLVRFHKGIPPKDIYTSRMLSSKVDKVIEVYEDELKSKFFK